jgi:uncharacterized protein (TIGR03790 family)
MGAKVSPLPTSYEFVLTPFAKPFLSRSFWFTLFLLPFTASLHAQTTAAVPAPSALATRRITPEALAVIVNDDDPRSVAIGEYYREKRKIPNKNIIHVHIPGSPRSLPVGRFNELKLEIESQLEPSIQAVVMVWTAPYAVECNSITSAFTLGFDASQCANTCAPGKPSLYFNAATSHPLRDLGIRPSMLLPTDSVEDAKALIDRGIQSEFRVYPASAYFLITSDTARNSRSAFFPRSTYLPKNKLTIETVKQDNLVKADDIMIYQTGAVSVSNLDNLKFRPGALADHLTSAGGDLYGRNQMSSLRWLEAGATASYGTVSEPCNYWQKFPQSTVLLRHYLQGDAAIEAYWKSVLWPAQGVFIGEPLAAPYHR